MILAKLDSDGVTLVVATQYVASPEGFMSVGGSEPRVGGWTDYADIPTAAAALGVSVPSTATTQPTSQPTWGDPTA